LNRERIHIVNPGETASGPVVYWMSRDQRVNDNWALIHAANEARKRRAPLAVVFNLVPEFLGATVRQYDFMLNGLREIEKSLQKLSIPFVLLTGKPATNIPLFLKKTGAGLLVKDFSPLKINRLWTKDVAARANIPIHEVDAHNIVPCRIAAGKQEFGAYTIRPRINRRLGEFFDDFPRLRKHAYPWPHKIVPINWQKIRGTIKVDNKVAAISWLHAGEKAARKVLKEFIAKRLISYDEKRNDPNENGQSNLSPYLHFGQISAQRAAMEIMKAAAGDGAKGAFLEELIIRRELSDNFCFYNNNYDNPDGFPDWAKRTLNDHRNDPREYSYSTDQFEMAETHDDLWNAAQKEMVITGKMQGFMRMYWAKKILEWTPNVEKAMIIAIYLNDKYELDGRDPNGYAGIAWSLGGVHDRAWGERDIFGKIRYMNFGGCKRKFDVAAYIEKISRLGALGKPS